MKKINIIRKIPFLILLLVVISLCMFSYGIGRESIWNDEWFTVNLIQKPDMGSCIKEIVFTENNPPLYYVLLRWWAGNGTKCQIGYLRMFSVLFGVLAVCAVFYLGYLLFGVGTGFISALLCATSPYIIWYAQEARNGIMEMFFALIIMVFFFRYCRNGRITDLVMLSVFQVLGVYTHYFLFLLLPAQLIYLIFFHNRRKLWSWLICAGLVVVLFSCWVPSLIDQLKMARTSWLDPPTVFFPTQLLSAFSNGIFFEAHQAVSALGMMIFTILFVKGMFKWSFHKKYATFKLTFNRQRVFILLFFFVPLCIAYVISFIKPVLYEGKRYLILIVPLYLIFVAQGMLSFIRKELVLGLVAILICLNLYQDNYIYAYRQKRQWDKACVLITRMSVPGDVFFGYDYSQGRILGYYGTGYAKRIEIPDLRWFKKAIRHHKRLWFVAVRQNTYPERLFGSVLDVLSSRYLTNSQGLGIQIILYDCSKL